MQHSTTLRRPGEGLKKEKMPGHWVLARLGKRVLRPGGMELTRRMLERLAIKPSDEDSGGGRNRLRELCNIQQLCRPPAKG